MYQQTINHAQSSWKSVEAIVPPAAELFYINLFKADSSDEQLFKDDMTVQGQKLMQMLASL
jgi:methyl-accepting chemotaxis protein